MPGCVVTVDSFGEEIQLHYLGLFYRKIHIKEGKMEEKKDVIYISSKEALIKIFVLVLTIGISIMASLFDYKSCYVTMVKRESIAVIFFAIVAIIASIVALLDFINVMHFIWMKMLVIAFVTIPLVVVYNDYRINVIKENQLEG